MNGTPLQFNKQTDQNVEPSSPNTDQPIDRDSMPINPSLLKITNKPSNWSAFKDILIFTSILVTLGVAACYIAPFIIPFLGGLVLSCATSAAVISLFVAAKAKLNP